MQWFEREAIRPRVVGEFEDSALLKTFGASGMGVFPAAEGVPNELVARYRVRKIGRSECVACILRAAGAELHQQAAFQRLRHRVGFERGARSAAAALGASTAPRATRAAALSGERFHTVTR